MIILQLKVNESFPKAHNEKTFTGKVIVSNGNEVYYKDGLFHNDNGQAVIYADGSKRFYNKGLLHNSTGPAIENIDGTVSYWLHGTGIY